MATFSEWIHAAAPHLPPLAIKVFSSCPISGISKHNLLRIGYVERMAIVGGRTKAFRRRRHDLVHGAFYVACRNYWCVRRCIVRWRERRMMECGPRTTLVSGAPLATLPPQTLVRVTEGRNKYTFYVRDLIQHIDTRLRHSDYFIPEPLAPTNPMTAMVLSESALARIILTACTPTVSIRLPPLVASFWRSNLDRSMLAAREMVMLHELALQNEAYQGGAELLEDLLPMYTLAEIPEFCPNVVDADRLSLISILIETHKTTFHSYYVATRSWCEYLSAVGAVNLGEQCMAALKQYYSLTHDVRMQDAVCRRQAELLLDPPLNRSEPPPPLLPGLDAALGNAAAGAEARVFSPLREMAHMLEEVMQEEEMQEEGGADEESGSGSGSDHEDLDLPDLIADLSRQRDPDAGLDALDIADLFPDLPGPIPEGVHVGQNLERQFIQQIPRRFLDPDPIPDAPQAAEQDADAERYFARHRAYYTTDVSDELLSDVDEWAQDVFNSEPQRPASPDCDTDPADDCPRWPSGVPRVC